MISATFPEQPSSAGVRVAKIGLHLRHVEETTHLSTGHFNGVELMRTLENTKGLAFKKATPSLQGVLEFMRTLEIHVQHDCHRRFKQWDFTGSQPKIILLVASGHL